MINTKCVQNIDAGDVEAVKTLINNKTHSVNDTISSPMYVGEPTLLEYAIMQSSWKNPDGKTNEKVKKVALFLLENGADSNGSQNGIYATPLHQAVHQNDAEMVKALLEHGADASIKDGDGLTAYAIAVERGNKEIKDIFDQHKMRKGFSQVRTRPKDEKDIFFSSK